MGQYQIMTGNEACAKAAIAAGMRFFAGYPITPATEIAEISSEILPTVDGVYMQMEDELASIGAIIGACAAGKKAMTATSGPGFSLMQENLGWACENEMPIVIVDVMRLGPSGGSATLPAQGDIMQTKWGTHGDHPRLVLMPNSVEEIYTETIRAFNLAEKFRQPVILLYDAILAHMSEKIYVPDENEIEVMERMVPTGNKKDYLPFSYKGNSVVPLAKLGEGYHYLLCGLIHDETGFPMATGNAKGLAASINHLMGKLDENYDLEISYNEEYQLEDADIVVVSTGIVSRSAKKAVELARAQGINVGLFRPITMWPFAHDRLRELIKNAKTVIVAEMNIGQLNQVVIEDVNTDQKLVNVQAYDGTAIKDSDILTAIKEANHE